MYITKKQSRVITLVILAAFFAVVCILLVVKKSPTQQQDVAENAPAATPTPSGASSLFTLTDFKRSEVKNGKKMWEIVAQSGQFFPSTGEFHLITPNLTTYQKDGGSVTLLAEKARITLEGTTLNRAILEGNVRIEQSGKYTIATERADYDRALEQVYIPGLVTVKGAFGTTTGREVTIDTKTKNAVFRKDVHTVILRNNITSPATNKLSSPGKDPKILKTSGTSSKK
jgi:LPS export ABC transporter protein LptC